MNMFIHACSLNGGAYPRYPGLDWGRETELEFVDTGVKRGNRIMLSILCHVSERGIVIGGIMVTSFSETQLKHTRQISQKYARS